MRLFGLLLLMTACGVEYGDMPALCPEGSCPDGYDCIQGVCALPGSTVPTLVEELGNLRGGDLRLVSQTDSVLVLWESYPYAEPLGEAILAKRLYPDGTTSEIFTLVDQEQFAADPGAVEPYFDVITLSDTHLLVAVSASPVESNDPRPRIRVFSVEVPGPGQSGEASSQAAWPDEILMSTVGYGNVSQPRFARAADGAIQLGYFEGVVEDDATFGRLVIFSLADDGSLLSPAASCPLGDATCCPSDVCVTSARDEAIAAGVAAVNVRGGSIAWTVDETRPSCIVTSADPTAEEVALDDLAVPLSIDAQGIASLVPSKRGGDGLPDDPVEGPARLVRRNLPGGAAEELFSLPTVRDTPRPAWLDRGDGRGLLVTPGADIASPELHVYELDIAAGTAPEVLTVARLSSLDLGSVQAATAGSYLYVAWLDTAADRAIIRAVVSAAP